MTERKKKLWKLVLTGGPCGGKTTGQTRLATFFENLGWKVYRVPETANLLLSGGINFADLTPEAAEKFQVCIHYTGHIAVFLNCYRQTAMRRQALYHYNLSIFDEFINSLKLASNTQ